MKTTIREAIQNVNVLLDTVYKHSLENPKDDKSKNVINYEGYLFGNVQDLLKKITGIYNSFYDLNFKSRIITIDNAIVLKFKTKKVKYSAVSGWNRDRRTSDEAFSVVEIEVVNGEKYLDMTSEEFNSIRTQERRETRTKEQNNNKSDAEMFISKLAEFGMTFEQFTNLRDDYSCLSFGAKDILSTIK